LATGVKISNTPLPSQSNSVGPVLLITEIDTNILTTENLVRALVNLMHAMREAVGYILLNDVERRVMVKTHMDPARLGETMWMTKVAL
jgi:hypothetical protein